MNIKAISKTTKNDVMSIVRFTLPIILTNLLQQMYIIIDHMIASNYAGDIVLAQIGATSYLSTLFTNLVIGVSVGVSAVVAQAIGRKNDEEVHKTIHTAMGISIVCGVLVGILGNIFCFPLLSLMKTPDVIIHQSTSYMRIIFAGFITSSVYNFGAAILRAIGDTKKPLYFLCISGGIKIVMTFLFVAVFDFGVRAIAVSTIISQIVSAILVIFTLTRKEGVYKLYLKKIKIYFHEMKLILFMGIPIGLQTSMFSISNVIIQSSINTFGEIAVAGASAAGHINSVLYAILTSMSHASTIYCSRAYGAKDSKALVKHLKTCLGLVVVVGIVCGGTCHIFKKQILGMFVKGAEAIAFGDEIARVICLTYLFNGAMEAVSGGLRALNKSTPAMLSSVFGLCVLRIVWVYTYFASHRSLEVLYYSYPLSWIITLAINTVLFVYYFKREYRNESNTVC